MKCYQWEIVICSWGGKTITLMPMTQHEVYLDQKCLSKKEKEPDRDDNGTLIKHANFLMKVFKEKDMTLIQAGRLQKQKKEENCLDQNWF